MAIRKIRTDEDPILRKKSRVISNFNSDLKNLEADMYETMYQAEGVGLAGVQVGILKRIFVIDDHDGTKITFINPTIEETIGEVEGFEGCLSVPDRMGKIDRAESIKISYFDIEGNPHELQATDFLARIIQHENDHLDGILYIDKAKEIYDTEESEDSEKPEEVEE